MLKRHQILLEDWQVEFIKDVAERYGHSFSGVTRGLLSAAFLQIVPLLDPDYQPAMTDKELLKLIKKMSDPRTTESVKQSLVSKLYFDARKAVEHRIKTTKTRKKK